MSRNTLTALVLALAAGCSANSEPPSSLTTQPWRDHGIDAVESALLLATPHRGGDRLIASKRQGLLLTDGAGDIKARLAGAYGAIDQRAGSGLLVATVDLDRQQAMVTTLDKEGDWADPVLLPRRHFKVDGLCLHRAGDSDYLFLVGEEGIGEQWLVAQGEQPLPQPLRVRGLSLPPASEHCRVDDLRALMFINEEEVGLWAYAAGAEADLARQPVALRQPFGDIAGSAADLALVADGVLLLDAESSVLHRYRLMEGTWQAQPPLALPSLDEPEGISLRGNGDTLQLLLRDDAGLHSAELPWQVAATPPTKPLPVLKPRVQTAPMPSLGDAADDPAIWVHPQQPGQSRVVTTDKQGGVVVYDLEGGELQDLRVGRINNIDVRGGFRLGGELVDLAVGSNRDHNSLHLFAIDRASGELRDIGEVATPLEQIYGICLYQEPEGAIHAIANDKDGTFLQYRLSGDDGAASGELVRRFAVNSQPEGCVADDRRQRLFVGEEDVAVWALDARATAPANLVRVIATGDGVEADIEGLAIYHGNPHSYLVISSQGNDSYVVLDAEPPFAWRGAFRIGPDAAAGIDGVSETDGLEVTSADLGGPWSSGMLVVQDGRKRMPEGNQNYKYVAWTDIAAALGLE